MGKEVKPRTKLDRIIQLLIPPSLVLLLVVTIIELFYQVGGAFRIFIDIFDAYVIIIFAIDLHYRWKDLPRFWPYVKKHWLDIIATIPFNFIFYGIQGLTLIKALRGVRFLAKIARLTKLARFAKILRLVRFGARAPRFIRIRKHVKKGKIRKVQPHEKKMKGVLSFRVILLITINSIMGTGIYFLTAAGAKHAGPASLISWGILSVISIYIAMCFSELAAMFPKAGGVYEFAKQAYGRFWSFVIGWSTAIAGSVTIAMLLLGALQYALPNYPQYYIPVAFFLIILFNAIAYRGMKTSTVMLVSFALITLFTVIGLIVPGLINMDPNNFKPFFVFPTFAVMLAIFFIAETFFGWESAVFLSAETKNPTKVMPKALIWGTVIIAILSFTLTLSAMGVIPWETYGESVAPLRDLGSALFGSIGGVVFTVLVFISIIGAVACWVVTAPRLLMSIAEDKLFFVQFAKIHPKHKSPYVSIGFQVLVLGVLVVIGSGSYEMLLHMLIPLILLIYSAVLISVVILRWKKPDMKRPYRVPFGKIGPIFTMLFMLFLLAMFVIETHGAMDILRISGSLILFGIPAYFAIELFYDNKYVDMRRNLIAKLRSIFHNVPRPMPAYKKMVSLVEPLNKKSVVVDYNSPLGIVGKIILKKHNIKKLIIRNSAKAEIKHLRKQIKNKKVIIEKITIGQIGKDKVTHFISHNDLGHVKNVDKFVAAVSKSLVKGGKFCFYISHHWFNVSPNALLIEDKKKIKEVFAKNKLKANYMHKKFVVKKGIFIYGEK
jgi:APA family basic amino acid/polyamine antiporter